MIENSECENLTGVELHWKLNFDDNIPDIYKKLNEKLNALTRIALSIRLSKRLIQMNAFFSSQFTY